MANLTSTLTVKLNDDVSGPAGRAAGALHKLGASGADLKKLAGAGTGKLASELEHLQQAASKLNNLRGATKQLAASGADFRTARQNVTQLTTALTTAEKKLAGLKGLRGSEGERQAAAREVQGIKRELRAASAVMAESKAAYLDQGRAVRGLHTDARAAGLSLRNLHAVESQLADATKRTNAAMAMRSAMLGPSGKLARGTRSGAADAVAARMAEADHGRQLAARDRAHSARMVDGMGGPARATREAAAAAEGARAAKAEARASRRAGQREAAGTVAAAAGVGAGHLVSHGAHASLETYREFDKERRFGKAVMGISDEEQEALVHQAIHMGASTRYNDVSVMESQRELAARGLKKDQVMGLIEPAGDLGQSLDLKLPDAVKQMEGAIFGFKKNISTLEAAQASARQTADVQVKAAKISGMTPEDISQTYKYGATPARMAGLSEETLLAFGGISKKANMGGDEAGTAFRALVANAMSPTRKAKEAMLANGMDYKNYQRNPDKIDTAAFSKTVSAQYGVNLDKKTTAGLDKIFTDKAMIADPSKFTPAVMKLLGDNLGGDDAKSKKSIAGLANRFRDSSMKGVDANKLVADLMEAIPKNPALANAIFGSKQGARIANALGDPETFKHMLEELVLHSQGYAEKIAKERQAGFDGAMDRLKGASMNLETAVGRAWDNNGKGGILTKGTDLAGKAIQGLAELDGKAIMAGTALMGLAGSIGTVAGALRLAGTFMGLPALAALGGMAAAVGAVTLAATAAAAALYVFSDEKKGLVHGGKPDIQMNPGDELPGLGSDPDVVKTPSRPALPGVPRMSLRDGMPSLANAEAADLPGALAKAREEAAGLRKELAEAEAAAQGMGGIDVPGLADAAKKKAADLRQKLSEAEGRERGLGYESYGPNLPPSVAPKGDASGLDPVKQGLDDVKTKGGEVNELVIRPQADASGLGTIISQLDAIISRAAQANAAVAGISAPGGNTGRVRAAQGNNH